MIYFLGTSFAPQHLKAAAIKRGVSVTYELSDASLVFVSEDAPVAPDGSRDLSKIRDLIEIARSTGAPIVLTSQVPPGFTRSLDIERIWHQAETLRIKDATLRAMNPDYIAVGGESNIPREYADYLISFGCPVLRMSWESAEMSKIAVNMMLAAQVDYTNMMSEACRKAGAKWVDVSKALHHDKRIGPEAYLTPGRWQDSLHLLRDWHTLQGLK